MIVYGPGEQTVRENDQSPVRSLHIQALDNVDHRTLFTIAEVEQAYSRVMEPLAARDAARITMDTSTSPLTPGKPVFFTEDLLVLLAQLSEDVRKRVHAVVGDPSA